MRAYRATLTGLVAAAGLAFGIGQAHAVPVGLELSLLIDVSGSVDGTEFTLQKTGYVQAFQSAAVQAAIAATPGGVAVNFIQWSGSGQQSQSIGWTLLTDATSANNFATSINGTARAFSGSTAPGSAINFATPLFSGNGFEGDRLVIDVSGDGAQNDGADTSDARDAALAAGIDAINGIAILGEGGLLAFYQNNIQGGTNSFTVAADNFADFADAIEAKLEREIRGGDVPEPASMLLLGAGLLGLGVTRRRKA